MNKEYYDANDLVRMGISYTESLKIIKEVQIEMKEKNYYVPKTKTKLALANLVEKKLGIKR